MSTLKVPGARLHYRARGAGPFVLFLPDGPTAGAVWDPTADALADDHATVTFDPRDLPGGDVDDPTAPVTVETRADDAAALLTALGVGPDAPAYVFGGGTGAITGLALVARHPGLVHTLIAHEPPVTDLLPDDTAAADPVGGFRPDVEALRACGTRIVVSGGRESRGEPANQAAEAFAGLLGEPLTELPGDHGGLDGRPGLFAEALRGILAGK